MSDHKKCAKCAEEKSLDQFRMQLKHGRYIPWARCRDCESAYYRSPGYRAIANQKNTRYRAEGRSAERERRHAAIREQRHPEKRAAIKIVLRALRTGALKRPDKCSECQAPSYKLRDGKPSVQAHHDDYSQPLSVRWLCHSCHVKHHNRARASMEAHRG